MPWVRLDDHFPDHPKIVAAGPLAAWLYVAALCYCNRLLTDGFVPVSQVERLLPIAQHESDSEGRNVLAMKLCTLSLWSKTDRKGVPGFLVHDYRKYQPSRKQILNDRAKNATRQERFRSGSRHGASNAGSNGKSNAVTNTVSNSPPVPNPDPVKKRDVPPNARSKRPIFKGQRLVVFEWQLDDCMQILGKYTDTFDLDAWFYQLDARIVSEEMVIPKRDNGAWLQSELLAEAKTRRLSIAGATKNDDPYAKFPTAWTCRTCGEIHEGSQDQKRRGVCLKAVAREAH